MNFRQISSFIGKKTLFLFFCAAAVGICWFFVEASFVYVLQIFLVSIGLIEQNRTLLPDWLHADTTTTVVALVSFGALRSTVNFFRFYLSGITNQSFVKHQRSRILAISLAPQSTLSSHESSSLFNETITNAGMALMRASDFIVFCTSLFFFLALGYYFAPYELVISVSLLALCTYPLKRFNSQIFLAGQGLEREYSNVNKMLLITMKNKLFLELLGKTEEQEAKGNQSLTSYEGHYKRYHKIFAFKLVTPVFLGVLIIALVTLLSQKHIGTAPMKLVAFFYVFLRLSQSASEANSTLTEFKLYLTHFRKLFSFNKMQTQSTEPSRDAVPLKQPNVVETISFQDINFGYKDKEPILKNFNLILKKNDRTLIKGPSGSGKSTLVQLICKSLKPASGTISINRTNLNDVNVQELIGYAGSEPFLIDDTIRNNLLFGGGSQSISDEKLIQALKLAEIWETVSALPGSLDFRLHEQAQLSTGQKQRIALARVFSRDHEIVVLDEATSNIDVEVERAIFANAKNYFENKIVILITHRDSLKDVQNKMVQL